MSKRAILTAACIAAVWLWTPHASAGQGYSGNGDYQTFCSSCHGASAKGDGIIAKSLPKRPPDLTQLSIHNDGVYPTDKVFTTIEGKTGSAHGNSDMPVWGDVFSKSSESQGPEATKARITALVEYLKTLQEKR